MKLIYTSIFTLKRVIHNHTIIIIKILNKTFFFATNKFEF